MWRSRKWREAGWGRAAVGRGGPRAGRRWQRLLNGTRGHRRRHARRCRAQVRRFLPGAAPSPLVLRRSGGCRGRWLHRPRRPRPPLDGRQWLAAGRVDPSGSGLGAGSGRRCPCARRSPASPASGAGGRSRLAAAASLGAGGGAVPGASCAAGCCPGSPERWRPRRGA